MLHLGGNIKPHVVGVALRNILLSINGSQRKHITGANTEP